jgi:hypothetical protein
MAEDAELKPGSTPWKGKTLREWWERDRANKAAREQLKAEYEARLAEAKKKAEGGEAELLRAELIATKRELSAARSRSPRGAAGDSVGGHPAIASFRTWTFDEARKKLLRLPNVYQRSGPLAASIRATVSAAPDIDLLGLAPPMTARTVLGRDRVQKQLSDPSRAVVLMLDEPAALLVYRATVHAAEEHYYRPAIPHLFRRTSEVSKSEWS